jgi:hypothetical protein
MFNSKNINTYLFVFSIVVLVCYFGLGMKESLIFNDEYGLIRKYLLNDSPLYGFNKPKLWIHSTYEVNSRQWKSFQSRNTTDLNQPYLHLTIKTIINNCGEDFNICLIDDASFSKLLPSWDIDLNSVAEQNKSYYREIGMASLVYYYGGMIVPNSFLCLKNLKPLYIEGTRANKPFVCESKNNSVNKVKNGNTSLFTPNVYFMGAKKNNETVKELIEYLKSRSSQPHVTSEYIFTGDTSEWIKTQINIYEINLIRGDEIGVKTLSGKPILLEDLMEENYLELSPKAYGIYIPSNEILLRKKYQWFAIVPSEEIFNVNAIIVKHLKASIIDSNSEYVKSSEIKTVVSI